MIKNCPICGKAFDVLYPDWWRYVRNNRFLCSWSCIRKYDKDGKEATQVKKTETVKRQRMSRDDMQEAVRMWREDDAGLDQYLMDHGVNDVIKWKRNAKIRYGKEPAACVKVDGPIRIETPETNKVEVVEVPEKMIPVPPPIDYKVTGISTTVGDWQFIKKAGYLDWTTLTGETVSMNMEEWKEFMKVWPFVLKVLEVEL